MINYFVNADCFVDADFFVDAESAKIAIFCQTVCLLQGFLSLGKEIKRLKGGSPVF